MVSGSADGAAPDMGRLRIVVPELASNAGTIQFYIHNRSLFVKSNLVKREAGECLQEEAVEIADRSASWTTDPLPYGEYAIIVHHDVNGDGVVNFGTLLPTEAIGYSNYDHGIATYPDFDHARVSRLSSDVQEVRVEAFLQGRLFNKHKKQ
jgi:uncharacterized protein (DUF2141 family)